MRFWISALLPLVLSACAPEPGSIKAIPQDNSAFMKMACPDLFTAYQGAQVEMDGLYTAQSGKRTTDTAGVILIGLPLGSMTSDNLETKIGVIKGRLDAIQQASVEKKCQR